MSLGVDFYYKERFLNGIRDYRPTYLTCRSSFDAYLLELAEKQGAAVYQGAPVVSIDQTKNAVSLRGGRTLLTDFIIGADGVNGRVARHLYPNHPERGNLALGLEIELPRERFDRVVNDPEIYFGFVRWGYGWIFPKRDTLTIGISGLLTENPDLKTRFADFLHSACEDIPDLPWKGHHLPFGSYRRVPGKKNVLLAGDAAGLAEPITGEGIAFAMQSGKYAAEAMIDAARAGDPAKATDFYLARYRSIVAIFRGARLLRPSIFSPMLEPLFVKSLERSTSVIRKFMDLIADEIGYQELAKFLTSKAARTAIRAVTGRVWAAAHPGRPSPESRAASKPERL
jgi:flavin-dependent dehydrogenase